MNIIKMLVLYACTLSGSLEQGQSGFPRQAARVLQRVRLPPERLRAMPHVLRDLALALQENWPGSTVTPFGSMITGLGIRGSDVDCFAQLPNSSVDDGTVVEAKRVLDRYPLLFHRPTAVLVAKVPHVRFIHIPTGHQCDVSFQSPVAVRNTALLRYLMRLDQKVLDLTTIVKYWSKLHKPPGERRIMANYAMISLVIFYLQRMNVLPTIVSLQENVKSSTDLWNMNFDKIPYHSSSNYTLYELLGGFFEYYSKFDFEYTIVSVFTGTEIKRTVFEDVDAVPDVFTLYKRNVANNRSEPLCTHTAICIQDAFILNSNLASDTSAEVLNKFKLDLNSAAKAFADTRDDFLEFILEGSEDIQGLKNEHHRINTWFNSTDCIRPKTCGEYLVKYYSIT